MPFPSTPMTGKNGKLLMSNGDGALSTLLALVKQTAFTWKGKVYANRMYLAGTGKTLINPRPELEPHAFIDGILSGIRATPTTNNDEVQVSAGSMEVNGVVVDVAADLSVAVARPAATQAAWVAISVNKSTGAFTATKGTDTTAGTGKTGLLTTYGTAAGEKPYIPTTDLLVNMISLINGAAPVGADEIEDTDREYAGIDVEIFPNIGGVAVSTALPDIHTGGVDRGIKFTGYFMDGILQEIGTAKTWECGPNNNTITDRTFSRDLSKSELSNWTWSAEQLAVGRTALDNILEREGFAAIRMVYPNGGYWQTVGSYTARFRNDPGSFNNITMSGTCEDQPKFV